MRAPRIMPLPGTLLYWGGLLTLVLAIVGGVLGMHVIGGGQASPMTSAHVSSAGITATATMAADGDAAHSVMSSAIPAAALDDSSTVTAHHGNTAVCGCSSAGCDTFMASHGACTPFAGAATPAAPQPGLVPDPAASYSAANHAGHKSAGRVPGPPSLTQLSISRT